MCLFLQEQIVYLGRQITASGILPDESGVKVYRSTKEHANDDALSRMPLGPDVDFDKQEWCNNVKKINLPTNHNQIQKHAANINNRVKKFVSEGWPIKLKDGELMLRFTRKLQLTIEQGLLCLQGNATRVVIPKALQKIVLQLLHEGHWGVIKMKQLARQHCWWVGIDRDIERKAAKCTICCITSASPKRTYASWPTPEAPWVRIHIDFAGPDFNAMCLICVDDFSQFAYIIRLSGFPKCIVCDNGPQLTSEMFRTFCYKNGVKQITTAPFHPAPNGLAERFVRTFKESVKKNIDDKLSINETVIKFLSSYRFLPNSEGKSPAEILHGRAVRTLVSQISEPFGNYAENLSKNKYDLYNTEYLRNFSSGLKYIKGVIKKQLGRKVYIVQTATGCYKHHQNQLKRCETNNQNNQENNIQPEELTWQTISSQTLIPEPEKSAVNPSNAFEELRRALCRHHHQLNT
ncbi:uncharacterized protein K02A2.6-like [Teleopsis dalmanni]|uniref:uncharacterized protein K02A2.6-like n=1 Tax=Teleopsis dalmanni TaxID=139649 RepID=UPI0018CED1DB|nr:uncharacterized protein K02A2.6-like [Teleopsis dalmanni]